MTLNIEMLERVLEFYSCYQQDNRHHYTQITKAATCPFPQMLEQFLLNTIENSSVLADQLAKE